MAQKKKLKRGHNAIREFRDRQEREKEIKRVAARWEKDKLSYEDLARKMVELFYETKDAIRPHRYLIQGRKKGAQITNAKKKDKSEEATRNLQELADRYWSKKPGASKMSAAQWINNSKKCPLKQNGSRYSVEYIASRIIKPKK